MTMPPPTVLRGGPGAILTSSRSKLVLKKAKGSRLEPTPISMGRLSSGPAVKLVDVVLAPVRLGIAAMAVSSTCVRAADGISCQPTRSQLPLKRASVTRRLVLKDASSFAIAGPLEISPQAALAPRTRFEDRR